jgi:hypothetical protein
MGLVSSGVLLACMAAVLFIGLALVAYGTIAKNDWGVNLDPVRCPRCNTDLNVSVRSPKSRRQALWGGTRCPNCGCEVDKWGRVIGGGKASAPADHEARRDPPPMTFKGLLLRNCLIFAPVLYVAEVLFERPSTLRYRLTHPIFSVILSTFTFTAFLMGLARAARREKMEPTAAPCADNGSQSDRQQ